MKITFPKLVQFLAGILVLMEAIQDMDTGFSFPWFYLIAGIAIISFVPLLPSLTSKFYLAGAVLFFIEGVILGIIALHLFGEMRKYTTIIYIVTSLILFFYTFRNIRKL